MPLAGKRYRLSALTTFQKAGRFHTRPVWLIVGGDGELPPPLDAGTGARAGRTLPPVRPPPGGASRAHRRQIEKVVGLSGAVKPDRSLAGRPGMGCRIPATGRGW